MVSDHANLNESLLESPGTKEKTKKKKLACCIISTLVLVGVIIALIFLVGPAIAQSVIDDTDVSIDKMVAEQIDDDNFHLDVLTTVHNPAIMGGKMLDTTIRMYVMMDGTKQLVGEVPFPAMDVPAKGSATASVSTAMLLTPELRPGVRRFIAESLVSDSLDVWLEATIDLKSLGMKYTGLKLDKQATMKGMSHLNVTVTDFAITDFSTFSYSGITNYHNPSNFEILMGNLTMNTRFQGIDAGNVLMTNVYIGKDTSYAPCTGELPHYLRTRERATAFADAVNGVSYARERLAAALDAPHRIDTKLRDPKPEGKSVLESDPFGVLLCTFLPNGTIYSNINVALDGIPINATLYPSDI